MHGEVTLMKAKPYVLRILFLASVLLCLETRDLDNWSQSQTHYLTDTGLELLILVHLSPKCWDYRHVQPPLSVGAFLKTKLKCPCSQHSSLPQKYLALIPRHCEYLRRWGLQKKDSEVQLVSYISKNTEEKLCKNEEWCTTQLPVPCCMVLKHSSLQSPKGMEASVREIKTQINQVYPILKVEGGS